MLLVRISAYLFVAYCVYSLSLFPPTEARSTDTRSLNKVQGDYFFFPYNSCVVLTVDDIKLARDQDCSLRDQLLARVKIERVLRGNFKDGDEVTVGIPESESKFLLNGEAREQLVGRRCIWAFNCHPIDTEQDRDKTITNIYCPIRGQKISDDDINTLQRNLRKSPYPYRSCIEVTVKKIEDKGFGYGHILRNQPPQVIASVRVDDVLLGQRSYRGGFTSRKDQTEASRSFRKGEFLRCNLGKSPPIDIFPKGPRSSWPGSTCIWSFNPKESYLGPNDPVLQLDNVSTPFPYQIYSPAEVQTLKADLSQNSVRLNELKRQVEEYVKKCCTIDRIRDFCQLENRCSGAYRSFPSVSNNRVLHGPLFSCEKKTPEVKSSFSSATWFVDVVDGVPRAYEIFVNRGGSNRWLFYAPLSLRGCSDDIFVRERLFQTINFSILNYSARHHEDSLAATLSNIHLIPPGKLVRSSGGQITQFKCCLSNGQTLTADLDEDLKIAQVFIAGSPSEILTKAISTTVENWDWCWRQRVKGRH